jgi:hypothetical protein
LLPLPAWAGWQTTIDGTDPTERFHGDGAFAVTVDATGDVVAAGRVVNRDPILSADLDFTVVKLHGQDGAEVWRQEVEGTQSGGVDEARAVAVNGVGDVIAAGSIRNTGTDSDLTIVKFLGADGTEVWRQNINGTAAFAPDQGNAVTVDSFGDVVAAGRTRNVSTDLFDFTVVKLQGGSGTEVWRRAIDGSTPGSESPFF